MKKLTGRIRRVEKRKGGEQNKSEQLAHSSKEEEEGELDLAGNGERGSRATVDMYVLRRKGDRGRENMEEEQGKKPSGYDARRVPCHVGRTWRQKHLCTRAADVAISKQQ